MLGGREGWCSCLPRPTANTGTAIHAGLCQQASLLPSLFLSCSTVGGGEKLCGPAPNFKPGSSCSCYQQAVQTDKVHINARWERGLVFLPTPTNREHRYPPLGFGGVRWVGAKTQPVPPGEGNNPVAVTNLVRNMSVHPWFLKPTTETLKGKTHQDQFPT